MAYGIEFEIARTHLPIAGILRHAHQVPDTVALIDHDTQITYGEFLPRIQQTALRLARAGVGRGDRVALVAGNCAEFPIAANAVNYLGAIIVPVNFRLAAGEIAYLLDDSSPQVVIADQEHGALVRSAVAESPLDIPVMDLPSLTAGGDDASVPAPVMCEDTDPLAIMYTSGTTGRPKGAVLTYSNFLSTTMRSSASWGYVPGRDSVLIASPMFHIAAFNVVMTNIANAAASVITPSKGFNAAHLLDVMAAHGVTHTFMVPGQWQEIVAEQQRSPRDLSLKFYGWGAAPASQALLVALRDTFPAAVSQASFGQTETTAVGMSLSHEDSLWKLGSVGLPDRNFSIRVVDAQMNDVPHGEVGEIVYRGPGVMDRFWNNEKATDEAFAGGWFHSGDLVRQDEDGYVYVVDRVKDMIISGGENIYCAELENVIAWHPKVAEVAVVVPRTDTEAPTFEEVREFCDGKLARYKLPKDVVIRDAFPRSGTGKIQKNVLREEI
jgi:acyl-CoA synthetase (AMP-forming)/AMP-acid ligase II